MSAEVDKLAAAVANLTTVKESVVTTLSGLAERLRAVAGDLVRTNDLADELDARASELAQAVVDNTVP